MRPNLPFEDVARTLQAARRILITVHQRPDGDALGSQLALSLMLDHRGTRIFCINEDPVPPRYNFLPRIRSICTPSSRKSPRRFDASIVLECAHLNRAGIVGRLAREAPAIINMDHHMGNANYGTHNLVDPGAPATVMLVEALRLCLGCAMTKEIALNLYVGLYTETGGFRYSNTTPEVLQFASQLIAAGVNPKWVGEQVYERQPIKRMRLLARALATLIVEDGIAWMSVSEGDFSALRAEEDDVEEFVEYPRMVSGVSIAVFMRETRKGSIRVSLRAKTNVPVNLIASRFGGGGHSYAAGCTLRGVSLAVARRKMAPVILSYLRKRRHKKKQG
jgi:phosphoesterase RecJ-like protein